MAEFRLRDVAILMTFVSGSFILGEYFVRIPEVNKAAGNLLDAMTVMAGLAAIVGVGNVTRSHLRNIQRRGRYWDASIIMIASLWVPLMIGLIATSRNPAYNYLYVNVYNPISNAFFALLGFYILSGAFRAFRARNIDAVFMLLSAVFIFLMTSPVVDVAWVGFGYIGNWIMEVGNTAGIRGVMMGVAIGIVTTSIRVLLGRETSYLGQGREQPK